jgi:hypothetical protein
MFFSKKKTRKTAKTRKMALQTRSPIFTAIGQFVKNEKAAHVVLYLASVFKGCIFPATAFYTAHYSFIPGVRTVPNAGYAAIVILCLAFSLPTAYQFGSVAFTGIKAKAFAPALELIMLIADKPFSYTALALLLFVNIIATYYNMSTGKEFSELLPKKEATATEGTLSIA